MMHGFAQYSTLHEAVELHTESPWLVLQYLPNGDLKNYLVVSSYVMHCDGLIVYSCEGAYNV